MTLYDLYLTNSSWTPNIILSITDQRKLVFIKAGYISESKIKNCEVLLFKGDKVRVDRIND